jgi:hypothetical protein
MALGLALALSGTTHAAVSPERTLRVLIVGNSYTRFNVLSHLLEKLARTADAGPRLQVDAEARSGFSLSMHLLAGEAMSRIRSGHYDFVVLQDHSLRVIDHPAALERDTKRFKLAVDATHGRTVLYETWARHPSARLYRKHPQLRSFEQMAEQIDHTYGEIAQRTGAELAPVGSAFERALASAPDLALWGPDGSHPTLAGSFLAACVLYATITGQSPRQTHYVPTGMPAERAERIQALAAGD